MLVENAPVAAPLALQVFLPAPAVLWTCFVANTYLISGIQVGQGMDHKHLKSALFERIFSIPESL